MGDMDDLAAWLEEQIVEDLQLASEAEQGRRTFAAQIKDMEPAVWGPVRVLAECEAKRRIIEHCRASIIGWQEDETDPADTACAVTDLTHVLKLMAVPYADRPGFREEWRP